ncbi:bifunctional 4-hydroxy-2-oxoglutarate aldolase/2-dehydro-3-deoxy-phosphogluconate aldolase [Spiribacter vilamensis]|uniref:2-dehydro-3-deoxy-phosphogluconate aldolase n=1 Tax=Spiribacter vilamensis TaxID=531306 RepID=A0A4Q8D050_9GAMM|nr:bifunctional 4-hydroxy-2-oxoglutarate aldolase/2-dehydro-3-deoxy-phosphogluconate aldolase [Spiribacter vilamensis]RZU98653.1 2-keto-3-deoxy-phosphogluconate aldolase [Spiribacter vilamensis]TVO60090.1 bifunctional 4-hydroxy-2-oxoglutarate aldolase/2-dehydro-3-deoxy-phosphogluconate aldolase [Spiribacter vilamensis]
MQALLARSPVIPVVAIEDAAAAPALARALLAGGLSVIEVTLRTDDALAAVAAIARDVPDITVGAGTLTTAGQVDAARDAGARFLVSPGYSDAIVEAAEHAGLSLLPGVSTATELMRAQADGFDHVKFFPAVPSGGIGALNAFSGPFPAMRFCPTGGVHSGNYLDFLQLPNVPCVGGSWLTPADAVAAGDWSHIETLAASAAEGRR